MQRVEHIGIAVRSLTESNLTYEKLLGIAPYKTEIVESEQVKTSFFSVGENKIELLEPVSAESAIGKFIEKRGEGIHHVAFAVENIRAEMKRLKDAGFTLLNEVPKRGADNKWVCFVHPKNAHGVLIELCEEMNS
jgi:methylmalonyl-CoA/ethylmalonyl-CoA epimerase